MYSFHVTNTVTITGACQCTELCHLCGWVYLIWTWTVQNIILSQPTAGHGNTARSIGASISSTDKLHGGILTLVTPLVFVSVFAVILAAFDVSAGQAAIVATTHITFSNLRKVYYAWQCHLRDTVTEAWQINCSGGCSNLANYCIKCVCCHTLWVKLTSSCVVSIHVCNIIMWRHYVILQHFAVYLCMLGLYVLWQYLHFVAMVDYTISMMSMYMSACS